MRITSAVTDILNNYESDNPGVKANLARMLMHGELAGTGRLIILPIDQGFEHGPARCFAGNSDAYDPHFHYKMAIDAGFSAYAAPLGMIEAGASTFAGEIPTILKMNSSNSLMNKDLPGDQAITASISDALRLGCNGIGFTIYPGSDASLDMFEEIRELTEEAKSCGLAVVIWSYPRGNISKEGETAIDVVAYGAHIACMLGAHIIKVKLPTAYLEQKEAKEQYIQHKVPIETLTERVRHIVQCCFNGRRIVVFSGGEAKDSIEAILDETRAIYAGGGNGSIIGRNCFKRPRNEALTMIKSIIDIYKN
ncbi:MAG: class I fructose-bisphosphate aldolase [Candidatus Paracaedibacteraceae bacterium]|nr:class I fructose-bisphosphate aldolase [Candidatus Paracaedibacteraceae bacterium]